MSMQTLGLILVGLLVALAAGLSLLGPFICLPWMVLSTILLHRIDITSEKS